MDPGQAVGSVLLKEQKEPEGHTPPHAEVPWPAPEPTLPAGQGSCARAPSGQKNPEGQRPPQARVEKGRLLGSPPQVPAGQGYCVSSVLPSGQ